MIVRYEQDVIS